MNIVLIGAFGWIHKRRLHIQLAKPWHYRPKAQALKHPAFSCSYTPFIKRFVAVWESEALSEGFSLNLK
jgi:hypothetical protein